MQFLLPLILLFSSLYAQDSLKLLLQITRHGAWAPSVPLPKDFSISKQPWELQMGALTPMGERQHYLLSALQH